MSSTRSRSAATDDAENATAAGGALMATTTTSEGKQADAENSTGIPTDEVLADGDEDDEDDQEGSGASSSATAASRNRSGKRLGSRKRGRNSAAPPSRSRHAKASQSADVEEGHEQGEEGEMEVETQQSVKKEDDEVEEGAVDEEDSTDTGEHEKGSRQRSVSGLKELAGLGLQTLGDGSDEPLMPRRSRRSGNGPIEGSRRSANAKEEEEPEEGQIQPKFEEETIEPSSETARLGEEIQVKQAEEVIADNVPAQQIEDAPAAAAEEEEGGEEGVTRCLCGSADENVGLMIQCETCKCWQHCICMGMRTEEDCPDVYFCEQCRPELHIPLLRLLGVLPSKSSKKAGAKMHGNRTISKDSVKELKEAKDAVLTLAKENEKRRREGREPVTGWSVAQAQEQENPQHSLEERDDLLQHGQMHLQGKAGTGVTPHKRQPTDANRVQRSTSRDDLPTPKSPPKRRSTMNSRDSVYGWEPIPPGLLNEDEVWSEEGKDDKEEGGRKRKRLGREEEGDGLPAASGTVSSSDSIQKRRRTSPGVETIEEEGGTGEQEGEEEENQGEHIATAMASQTSQRGGPQRSGRAVRESERPRHPNQYTKRAAAAAAAAAAGSTTNGENTSPGPSPHKTRADGMRRSTRETATSSRTGTPAPGEHSGRRGDGTWGLPDHLSHLSFLLPPGVGPELLKLTVPTAKGGPKASSGAAGGSGATRDSKTDRIVKASPQPFNMINLTEATTKIKYPGKRMTMGEMRKRVRNILEFVSRLQIESVERERRMRFLGISRDQSTSDSSNTTTPPSGSATAADAHETADERAALAAAAAREKESETAEGVAPGATVADEEREGGAVKASLPATTVEAEQDVSMQEVSTVDEAGVNAGEIISTHDAQAPVPAEPISAIDASASAHSNGTTTMTSSTPSGITPFNNMTNASSMALVDELTRDLLAFQNRFGTGTSLALSSAMGY